MRVPLILRIGFLVLATTGFYAYVGQMVPQREVHPPQEIVVRTDLTTEDMVKVGRELMDGKGLCFTCHTIGRTGALRFPDLEGVAGRAASRVAGLSEVEYLAQSIYEPDTFIVPGFNPGMPVINRPPIGLTDPEILCVIAYLQTLGGKATVTLQTAHRYYAGAPERVWGISRVLDQQLGGITMASEQAVVFFAVFAYWFWRFLAEQDREDAEALGSPP